MSLSPILILQMQRMGDIVLSFPLLGWLGDAFPGHPLWVIGEQRFFEPLMSLSPSVTYFRYGALPDLRGHTFALVINISHRREAAHIAGGLKAEQRLGPWLDKDGRLFISGDWQLYRASLTQNNRYNLYHWADLNALDCIPPSSMPRTNWPRPRRASSPSFPNGARIGLFLGASEAAKHPDSLFWAALASRLLHAGHKPVLLGGEAELPLGNAVAAAIKAPRLNLCNHFSIDVLARFIKELDLLITPDTGPMHIAAWLGTPTLNLSIGPVNPWETGPFSPGQHIARPLLDCAGCWTCIRNSLVCHALLTPESVAAAATAILADSFSPTENSFVSPALRRRTGSLEILRTRREAHGLYHLETLLEPEPPQTGPTAARRQISLFWQAWFGALFTFFSPNEAETAWFRLSSLCPEEASALAQNAASFALLLAREFRASPKSMLGEPDFWRKAPPALRPLSGYVQMYMQNAGATRCAFLHALSLAEQLAGLA